ncbi:hypothetical protein Tco_0389548 [Tanacetum coccineum]
MEDKEKKSTMKGFATNDQADYYSGITSITVNGKNAYELKGKFLDDLHNNAFSGANGKDAVKHIEYFLRIVDLNDLPNVNQHKLRVDVFPISLAGDAWRWFDGIKGSDEIEPTNEETSNLEETNHDDKQEIGEIFKIQTNLFDYETSLCEKFKEFNYLLKIDPNVLTKDTEGFKIYEEYKDDWIYEWNKDVPWYVALKDSKLKDEALRNKAIMEGLINDDVEGWRSWENIENTNGDRCEREYENDQEDEERCELFDNATQKLLVCTMSRFEMIKYSFRQDEEYVAVKEDEYEDLTNTSKDACGEYQEIFRMMDK